MKDDEEGLPELHMDYCFPESVGQGGLTILVAKEKGTKMTMSSVVPRKGTTGDFAAKRVVAFVKEIGLEGAALIIKTDQEEAMKAVATDVARWRGGVKTIFENSPVKSSGSNGIAERGIQTVVDQLRVMKDALESRWKTEIPDNHPVLTWMVEHASYLGNRFLVGRDGKTAYERLKIKPAKMMGIEFGEGVHFKKKKVDKQKNELAKMSIKWDDGIFLGVRALSGEMIVGIGDGVWKTRTVERKDVGERWSVRNAELVGGVPWKVSEDDLECDGTMEKVMLKGMLAKRMEEDEESKTKITFDAPQRFRIMKEDLERHGYTEKCPACREMLRYGQTKGRVHSESCRKRMGNDMADSKKVQEAKKRENDYFERVGDEMERTSKKVKLQEEEEAEEVREEKEAPAEESTSRSSGYELHPTSRAREEPEEEEEEAALIKRRRRVGAL